MMARTLGVLREHDVDAVNVDAGTAEVGLLRWRGMWEVELLEAQL